MKICNKCKAEYEDELSFCPKCGIPLEIKIEEILCSSCGKSLGKEAPLFCPYCGKATNIKLFINNAWFGFKGRMQQAPYLSKLLVLLLIQLVATLVGSYLFKVKGITFHVMEGKFDTSFVATGILLGILSLIFSIIFFGMMIRRSRDINKSPWLILVILIISAIIAFIFPQYPVINQIVFFAMVMFYAYSKSYFDSDTLTEDESQNKMNRTCILLLLLTISYFGVQFSSDVQRNNFVINDYFSLNRKYWVLGEDTFYVKCSRRLSTTFRSFKKNEFDNKNIGIARGKTKNGKEIVISFRQRNDENDLYNATNSFYTRLNGEEQNHEALINDFTKSGGKKEDYKILKGWVPKELPNGSYAYVLDYTYYGHRYLTYEFNNKKQVYSFNLYCQDEADEDFDNVIDEFEYSLVWNPNCL